MGKEKECERFIGASSKTEDEDESLLGWDGGENSFIHPRNNGRLPPKKNLLKKSPHTDAHTFFWGVIIRSGFFLRGKESVGGSNVTVKKGGEKGSFGWGT